MSCLYWLKYKLFSDKIVSSTEVMTDNMSSSAIVDNSQVLSADQSSCMTISNLSQQLSSIGNYA